MCLRSIRIAVFVFGSLSLLLATPLQGQIPNQGKLAWRHFYFATVQRSEFGKDKLIIADAKGVGTTKTGEGLGHNISTSCIVVTDTGAGMSSGYCTFTDLDGDQIFEKFERSAGFGTPADKPGKWQYTGGTGKYTGISGSGTYVPFYLKSSAPATVYGYSDHEGEYKLP